MKKRVKKIILRTLFIIISFIIILYLIRMISPSEIDDVTPGIPCPEIEQYNPKVLYVIPNYNNNPLSENQEWCNYILSLNKKLALHGVTHEYKEFLYESISQEKIHDGISEFEACFGFIPENFKPPQLEISKENKQLIKQNKMKFKGYFNQITHKVYHCSDDKKVPNKLIKIF